jgi:superfamily II DNA or RNA helicase
MFKQIPLKPVYYARENNILKENCFILDYENGRLIGINKLEQEKQYIFNVFCKTRLRRFIDNTVGNKTVFKESLTYVDFEEIISRFRNKNQDITLYTTITLDEYIKSKQMYINDRKDLGIQIKLKDNLCKNELEKYRLVLTKTMTRKLREQQLWDSFYMCMMKKCSNFSVPGSGKTTSVLGVFAYLQDYGNADKIVVICPKNAFESWKNEFNICFKDKQELKCFDVQSNISSRQKHYVLNYDYKQYNLFLFNYESLNSYKQEIKELVKNGTLLVYDEVHKAKGINGERATNSIEIAKDANYVITMTGTPIPNSYLDIYNNLHILYPNEYDSFFGFREQLLKNPNETERNLINERIKPFYCRTSKEQLCVPPANQDIFYLENATNNENRAAEILYSKYQRNKFALIIRLLQLESCPELLLEKLNFKEFEDILDITISPDELDYSDASNELKGIAQNIKITVKTKKCIQLIKNLYNANKPVIIWTLFRKSISNLRALLEQIGIPSEEITGGTSMEDRKIILDKFLNNKIKVLITNPQTLAESVSLHSVCHDAIYYEYSYNLVHLLQSKDRIHRLGLPDNQYTQYYYLQTLFKFDDIDYSLDEMIYDRLKLKEHIMLEAVDDGKLERVFTEQEDIDAIFKKLNF